MFEQPQTKIILFNEVNRNIDQNRFIDNSIVISKNIDILEKLLISSITIHNGWQLCNIILAGKITTP